MLLKVTITIFIIIIICLQVNVVRTNIVAGLYFRTGAQVLAIESCFATLSSVGGASLLGTSTLHKLDDCLRSWR